MKIVTDIFSQLARAADITDRDVVSNLDLAQESFFPLPPIPEPMLFTQDSGLTRSSSFLFTASDSRNNQAAAVQMTVAFLTRGLWRVQIQGNYGSNFLNEANAGFFIEMIDPVTFFSSFIARANPFNTTTAYSFNVDNAYLLPATRQMRITLSGNAVGQIHAYAVSICCNKYL